MFIELSTLGIKTYKYVRDLTDKGGLDIKLKTRFPKIYVT